MQLFSDDTGQHQDFRDALLDYLDFYETNVKPELIHFTQEFKRSVDELTTFLSLENAD